MARRDTTIALSDSEKERLDDIASMVADDPERLAYGDVLALLIDNYEERRAQTEKRLAQA